MRLRSLFHINVGLFISTVLFSVQASAETFFYKDAAGHIAKTEIDFTISEDRSIEFSPSKFLASFTNDKDGLKSGPLKVREPSEAEQIADTAVILLTSMLVLATHDTYDLSSDLRLSRMVGVFFFILPFEASDIYRKCGSNEYLIAVSDEPKDETLKQLKSLDEVRRLCGGESSNQQQS